MAKKKVVKARAKRKAVKVPKPLTDNEVRLHIEAAGALRLGLDKASKRMREYHLSQLSAHRKLHEEKMARVTKFAQENGGQPPEGHSFASNPKVPL